MQLRMKEKERGYTLVELLVTIAVFVLVFGGLFGAVQLTLKLVSRSKAMTTATSLANEQLEYIRSLPYNDVGTMGGIPNGSIPQNATTSLNGITFSERVLIQYIDSPEDGIGGADTNGILADYKQVKVEYSWMTQSGTSTIFLLTNVVPPGIETTAGGGTLTVNVFDAQVVPVSGAAVHLYNDTTTTTIDTTRNTNADGVAMFSGAPAAGDYQITVTKGGYSTDKTYVATTSNPNPVTLPVAVVESTVSTMNFQIDHLADLLVRTVEPATTGSTTDTFVDASHIVAFSDTTVTSDDIVLSGGVGSYLTSGTVQATGTAPTPLTKWDYALWDAIVPLSGTLRIHVYSVNGGVLSLIPDSDLIGNGAGFTSAPVDLSSLAVTTYPVLALGAVLTSGDVNETPVLHEWSITYTISEPQLPNIPFTLMSTKTIGTDALMQPIPKYTGSFNTDASGEKQFIDLEWDSYKITLDTALYDIKNACNDIPYALDPSADDTLLLTLVPNQAHTLRVSVVDSLGNFIPNADVLLSQSSPIETQITSNCGQVFFNTGLSGASDYTVEVHKTGYVTQTITPFEINGDTYLRVILST